MTNPPPNYLPVRQEWLDRRREPALEPELPIVDPHHHLWDRRDWQYLLYDLLADLATGHNIVATVFVQARAFHRAGGKEALRPVGETEFVNGVAAMSASGTYGTARICAGIVGHADLRLGAAVTEVLEAHIRAGGGRFRGIRHIVAYDADATLLNPANPAPPGLLADAKFREGFGRLAPLGLSFDAWLYHPQLDELTDTKFREGFARLAPLGLSFDAWLYHPQLDELTDLARVFPQTPIVLNHCGGVLRAGSYASKIEEEYRRWSKSIRALAACPNVHVKLGGLGMRINGFGFERGDDPPSSQTLATAWKPYMETCIEAFGAKRCMFESNFPVDKGSYGYGEGWNAFKLLAKGAGAEEKRALFHDTATRFYRLDEAD